MKIAVLLKISRQVEGEYIFVTPLMAHMDEDQLWKYTRGNNLPRSEQVQEVQCVIEYGIQEVELEGLDDLITKKVGEMFVKNMAVNPSESQNQE